MDGRRTIRIVLTALALVAALYAVRVAWRENERAAGLDFYIYFVAGQLAGRADVANIYGAEVQERIGEEYFERAQRGTSELRKFDAQRRRRLDLVSSPFLYTTLRWVSRDYDRALTQVHAFILACFIAGVLLIARSARLPWWGALFLLAALLLWYRGFEADLRVGNVNSMQLVALGAFLMLRRHPASWLILGALLLFKPNLLFVPLLLVVARQAKWKELAWGAAGAVAAFVIASLSFGSPRVWVQWIDAANQFYHRIPTRMERNVTPALALFHEYGAWVSYALAALLLAVACAGLVRRKSDDAPLLVGLGIVIYLLAANVVWLHYMVLVIPIAFALMRWRSTMIVALIALAMIAEEPYEVLTHRPAFDVEGTLIGIALTALFICGVWKLSQRDPRAAVG